MPDITPDQVTLNEDGTVLIAFPATLVDIDDRSKGRWVPAWTIDRPVWRELRELQALFARLSKEREDSLRRVSEAQAAAQAAIQTDTVDSADVATEDLLDAAEQMERTVVEVLWGWWTEMIAKLGTPVAPEPRAVDADDAPPWLVQTAALYHQLNAHWMAVPLVHGTSSETTSPTPTAPRLVPVARR
jgi:hypothetical protein